MKNFCKIFSLALAMVGANAANAQYNVQWVELIGATQANDILTKTTSTSYNNYIGGARSSNVLPPNTNGWIEFTITNQKVQIGFTVNDVYSTDTYANAVQISSTNVITAYENVTGATYGTLVSGTVFRISREGSSVKYYKNGTVFRTATVDPYLELYVRVMIYANGGTTPLVTSSFDQSVLLRPTIVGIDGPQGSGSITPNPVGGTSPYTYSWSGGGTSPIYSSASVGNQSVTVTDAVGRSKSYSYGLGYKNYWPYQLLVNENNGALARTSGAGWGSSGANGSNILRANTDGWVEFVILNRNTYGVLGFAISNSGFDNNASFSSAFDMRTTDGLLRSAEGATVTSIGNWTIGDVLRIERSGSTINYYRNGSVIRTIATDPNLDLKIKASIYSGSLPGVTSSFTNLTVTPSLNPIEGPSIPGAVSLATTSGVSPFSYQWTSGGSGSTQSAGSPINSTVTVTDAKGRSQTVTYGLGYKSYWINTLLVADNNGTLTRTSGSGWNTSGANGSNILPSNTDGWMEFVASNVNHYAVIGLASNPIGFDNNASFTNGLYLSNSGALSSYEGATNTALGSWSVCDVFRISREGSSIKYIKNGIVLRTITINPSLTLFPKAAILTGSVPPVTTSFQSLTAQASVEGTNNANGTGNISVNTVVGKTPITYAWYTGEQSQTLTNKSRGNYTLTVTDGAGRTATRTYAIGYKNFWTGLVGVSDNNGILTKTGTAGYNGGTVSVNTLAPNTDGWIEFISPYGSYFEIGFATNLTTFNLTSSTNALRLDNTNNIWAYEGATNNSYGNWSEGDVWRISREGTQMKYYRNGTIFRTVTVSAALQLNVKVVLYSGVTPQVASSFWIPSTQGNIPDIAEFNFLKDLYNSTAGASWTTKTNWPTTWPASATSSQMATWFGITVQNNDITKIQLSNNNLVGTIPSTISILESLSELDLSNNTLSGALPNLSSAAPITKLQLQSNQFTGSVPANYSTFSGLTVLKLQSNQLSGAMPDMASLVNLTCLWLGSNNFNAGPIPAAIGNMTNLTDLNLSHTNRTGALPTAFSNLVHLTNLQLDNNQLTGDIKGLVGLNNLTYLNLGYNQFNKSLPPQLAEMAQLQNLYLNNNQFTGTIPLAYRNLTGLTILSLTNNQLEGAIPEMFGTLNNLQVVDLSNNLLSGRFPVVNHILGLKELHLNNNNLQTSEDTGNALPSLYNHPNKANLDVFVADNYLDMVDLEPYFSNPNGLKSFSYTPQKKLRVLSEVSVPSGGTLLVTAIGLGQQGHVLWEKQVNSIWQDVTAQSEDGSTKTFKVSNATNQNGLYHYFVTSSIVPSLTLQSEDFAVYITDPLSTTGANPLYNGLITSMYWRTDNPVGNAPFTGKYNFTYDDKYQIQEADWVGPGGVALSNNKFRLDNMSYDPNGNILSLRRYDENGNVKNDFTYKYANSLNSATGWANTEVDKNQLLDVTGYTSSANTTQHGFAYNQIGQMTIEDLADGDDQFVEYDVTGKVRKVFSDVAKTQLKVEFVYDDRGFRLAKKNLVTNRTTWYIRDASGNILSIYEETAASLTQTEVPVYGSGKLGTYYASQDGSMAYELTDHLGNVRAVVRDNIAVYTATMEDTGTGLTDMQNPRAHETLYFNNIAETAVNDVTKNHTFATATTVPNPSRSSYLYWGSNMSNGKSIGPAMALRVAKGDKIEMETYAQYETQQGNYNHNLSLVSVASFLAGGYAYSQAFEGSTLTQTAQTLQSGLASLFVNGDNDQTRPFAFLNYIVFDKNLQVLTKDRKRVGTGSANAYAIVQGDPLTISTDGYLYVWVSNESENIKVWFDDLKITQTQVLTTQATDYGAWGDVARESKLDEESYRFGYQGQYAEKDEETGWSHFEVREYLSIIGRWLVPDPYGEHWSPYLAMNNNPINIVDPDGGCETCPKPGDINEAGTHVWGLNASTMAYEWAPIAEGPTITGSWNWWDKADYYLSNNAWGYAYYTDGYVKSSAIFFSRNGNTYGMIVDPASGTGVFGKVKGNKSLDELLKTPIPKINWATKSIESVEKIKQRLETIGKTEEVVKIVKKIMGINNSYHKGLSLGDTLATPGGAGGPGTGGAGILRYGNGLVIEYTTDHIGNGKQVVTKIDTLNKKGN